MLRSVSELHPGRLGLPFVKRPILCGFASILHLLLTASWAIAGEEASRAPLTMEAALSARQPIVSGLSWLGHSSVLLASWKEPGSTNSHVVSWDVKTGERRILADGAFASASPDGQWLVYLDGKRWRLKALIGGNTTKLGEDTPFAPTVFGPPVWSHDSRYVAIIDTLRPPDAPFNVESELQQGVRVRDMARVADGPALATRDTPRITLIDVKFSSKSVSVPVTETHAYWGAWGGGHELYFVGMEGYWFGERAYTALKRYDADTRALTEIYRMPGAFMQSAAPRVSPDGKQISLVLDVDNQKWDDFNSLVLVDGKSGKLRRVTQTQYVNGHSQLWSPGGRFLYVTGRHGGLDPIYRVSLDGKIERITEGERRYFEVGLSPDGRWLSYQTEGGYGRRDIRVRSTRTNEERIVAVLAEPARQFRLGTFSQVQWQTEDGLTVFGFVFLPPDFDAAKRYPLYVDVHGGGPGSRLALKGPLSSLFAQTPLEWHAWATLGYVVLVPDMRSSGEYGPQVTAERYAGRSWDWTGMLKDADDIEAGTRWMLQQPYIDRKRVAVYGHSAGGGCVNLLLTRSHLYGAGIVDEAIPAGALPFMLYSTTGKNTGVGFDESFLSNGFRLAQAPEVFTGGFLFDGYKSRTPTLILVGNPDKGAIDSLSSEVLFSVLRQYKVPTRMIRYEDDGHNPQSIASALHHFREIRAWLQRFIPADDNDLAPRP
jgi:dipeptidyl aminopeptidase/acylaminoacyl peptidase